MRVRAEARPVPAATQLVATAGRVVAVLQPAGRSSRADGRLQGLPIPAADRRLLLFGAVVVMVSVMVVVVVVLVLLLSRW